MAQSDETERTVNKLFVIAFKLSKQSDWSGECRCLDDFKMVWTILHFMIQEDGWEILLSRKPAICKVLYDYKLRIYVQVIRRRWNPYPMIELKNIKTIAAKSTFIPS